MAYIQSAAAEIRRGKKEEGRKKKNKLQYENIMVCPIPYDDHNRVAKIIIWAPSHKFVGLYLRNLCTYQQLEKLLKQ